MTLVARVSARDVAWALTQVAATPTPCPPAFFRTLELSRGDRAAILRDHLDERGHAAEQRKHVVFRSSPSLR